MDAILVIVNWPAVLLGAIVSFGLGMVWFGKLFGRDWAQGCHGINPPATPPLLAKALQLAGTLLLSLMIGATATINALVTAILVLVAKAALLTAGSLFSQKSPAAALIDGGFVLAMGAVMIGAQGIL